MKAQQKNSLLLFLQLSMSLAAIFGSLFFSEIMKFPPCDLCWYQRMAMYPIALIIMTGLFLDSKETAKFIFPFTLLGLSISIYHNLVYYKFIQVIIPCSETSPCTAQQLNYLGFITIPLLSIVGFSLLLILNITTLLLQKRELHEK